MSKPSPVLAILSVTNGAIALVTAIVFATGPYGAFRPQDTGGFRQIGGLLVAYAAVAFLAFAAATRLRRWDVVQVLAVVIVLGNTVFLFSPFHVPRNWHVASIGLSAFTLLVAFAVERPTVRGWASWLILLGSSVGGAALIAAGRYEPGPNASALVRAVQTTIAAAGLATFAVGAMALSSEQPRGTRSRPEA